MRESFRLDKDLMSLLLCEADDLVFDRRAVAGTCRVDLSRVHRRAMKVCADQLVRECARVCEPAENLRLLEAIGENRERTRTRVAGCVFESRVINGGLVDGRRRAGLQAAETQAERAQRIGERFRGRLAEAAAGRLHFSRM